MAVISPSTFEPLRRHVNVRLQQGVPIVDADWNEMDDIRRFEVRAFLKWFAGNGVPSGNDGFRIGPTEDTPPAGVPRDNNFKILSGVSGSPDGLRNVGRCLVDGLDVMISADLYFTDQPLHADHGASADQLAARLGVPKITALTTPGADGAVAAYLDVWERLVTPSEDPTLVLAGLGTESCARMKREWVLRVRAGSQAPAPGDIDFAAGHSYYTLAVIARRSGDGRITTGDIADRRETQLMLPPANLIPDLLGINALNYRQGQGRPAISFREAINALLRGELPSTPDTAISTDPVPGVNLFRKGLLFDGTGGLVAVWTSDRMGGTDQVFAARLDTANIVAGFSTPQQVTTGTRHAEPHAARLPNGDVLVAYEAGLGAAADIFMRRASPSALSGATEQAVANTASVPETLPFLVVSGNLAVVFYHLASTNRWQYRRFRHTDNTWMDAVPVAIPTAGGDTDTAQKQFHAALDASGNIWLAFMQGTSPSTRIGAMRLMPSTGVVDNQTTLDAAPGQPNEQPFVLCSATGEVWIYWQSSTALQAARFSTVWQAIQAIPGTGGITGGDVGAVAVEDTQRGIWLFWSHGTAPTEDVYFKRRNPDTGGWAPSQQLTISPYDDTSPFALVAPDESLWVVWSSDRSGNVQPFYKRLVTAL